MSNSLIHICALLKCSLAAHRAIPLSSQPRGYLAGDYVPEDGFLIPNRLTTLPTSLAVRVVLNFRLTNFRNWLTVNVGDPSSSKVVKIINTFLRFAAMGKGSPFSKQLRQCSTACRKSGKNLESLDAIAPIETRKKWSTTARSN